jgi:hypothetical protein
MAIGQYQQQHLRITLVQNLLWKSLFTGCL